MGSTYLHLTIVHVPVLGTLLGIIFLVYGMFSKNETFKKAGLLTFILTALISIPAFLTGDPAKEIIKNLPGISLEVIDVHEKIAEKAIWLIEFLGAISLVGLYLTVKKGSKLKAIIVITLVVSVVTLGVMAFVGNTGGKIRHSEIVTPASPDYNLGK